MVMAINVDGGADHSPNEARHFLCVAREHLRREGNGMDVRTVVGDDGKGQDDETEFPKRAQMIDQDSAEEAASAGRVIASLVAILTSVDRSRAHDGNDQQLGEQQRHNQSQPGPEEELPLRLRRRVINGVVGGVRGPPGGEHIHRRPERQHTAHLGLARLSRNAPEVSRVGEDPEHDREDDGGGQPRPELVGVYDLLAKHADDQGGDGDDEDAREAGNVGVDGLEELGADDGVDGGPAQTCHDIEEGDELDAPPAEPEARQGHLAETEGGLKGREEAHGGDAEQIEEHAHQHGVGDTEEEDRLGQQTNDKRRHDHIGRQPHGRHIQERPGVRIGALVLRHALDAALLDLQPAGPALAFHIQRVGMFKALAGHCACLVGGARYTLHDVVLVGGGHCCRSTRV